MVLLQAPGPAHYAVIRLDPECMVRDLGIDDAATLAEISKIHPRKYLIYLDCPGELPMPNSRWCRYHVTAIATTPRPPDATTGITSDMVLPIAPNSIPGRRTIYPNNPFPFSNCLHWFQSDLVQIRIRTSDTGFEVDGAIRLTTDQRMALEEGFDGDFERIVEFASKHSEPQEFQPNSPSTISLPLSCHDIEDVDSVSLEVLSATCWQLASRRGLMSSVPPVTTPRPTSTPARTEAIRLNAASSSSVSSDTASVGTSCASTETDISASLGTSVSEHAHNPFASMDLFGWEPNAEIPLIPLADLWLEIADHLTQEEIPSPLELYEEVRAIRSVMRRGLARYALGQRSADIPKQEPKAVPVSPSSESKAGPNSGRTYNRPSASASQPIKKSYAQTVAKGPQTGSSKVAPREPLRGTVAVNDKPRSIAVRNDDARRKAVSGRPHTPRTSSPHFAKLGYPKSPARQPPRRLNVHTAPHTDDDSDDPGWFVRQERRKSMPSSRGRYEMDGW
ncbi:hypothetical protein K466DRAFT_654628 [Polyporus arcularius HHB13444]|uniref:Uncharacterized protein n=1 Tax=Polyporus arcularius HHB13444 TaxID=1314778 RepID=A0A5C3P4X5_9APHY|nr:hypothetical protein K466DRAFT_654628 [Polyporus arcularius HHB13444]